MTFINKLKAHIGGLIHIKSQLYWYRTGKWDGVHESTYLLLDIVDPAEDVMGDIFSAATTIALGPDPRTAVLLFIDGTPKWVWIYSGAVELLK